MNFERELDIYLRARFTLVVVTTHEEDRAIASIKRVCERRERACIGWDQAEGFRAITQWNGHPEAIIAPLEALDFIDKVGAHPVIVLKDFHDCWDNARTRRKLRNVLQRLKFTRKSVIVLCPPSEIPSELRDAAVVIDYPKPEAKDIESVIDHLLTLPGVESRLTRRGRERLVQAALGLRGAQAERVFSTAIVRDGVLDDADIDDVNREKQHVIRESGALEYYPAHETPDLVGGLDVMKQWLTVRQRAFSQEARNYGLPAPKGIALIGIPGTGKSLSAKMIASMWRVPLIRFDVGALFGSMMGQSEQRAREALQLAELVAPCVFWIDEMEKALTHGGHDSGTSTRVFGTILTWMQEKTAPCFIVATANDVSKLPPELLRRGRFDEIFFLDLPTQLEREAIVRVHLRKRQRNPDRFDVSLLAQHAEGFVGAEIEQGIIDAMYAAFNTSREFTTADIVAALGALVPLSVAQRERVAELRTWLHDGRALSASLV